MTSTPGRSRLNEIIDPKTGRTQAWLAGLLGVDQSTVSDWVRGVCRPGDPYRKAMVTILGIPEADWETQTERRQVAMALKRAETRIPEADESAVCVAKPRRGTKTG